MNSTTASLTMALCALFCATGCGASLHGGGLHHGSSMMRRNPGTYSAARGTPEPAPTHVAPWADAVSIPSVHYSSTQSCGASMTLSPMRSPALVVPARRPYGVVFR